MKSIKMILLATAVLVSGNLIAEEGKRGKMGPMGGCHGMRGRIMSRVRHHVLSALELTEEQKEQAKGIREANAEKMKKYAKALQEAHKAIREASTADKVDESAIRDLSKNAGDAMAEMAILRSQMKKEFEAILTDEQKAKLEEKKAEVKERMETMKKKFQERRESSEGGCRGNDKKKKCDD